MKPFDNRGDFVPVEGTGLRILVVRSAAVTSAAQVTRVVLQLVSTLVLARLLAPADFGLLAMVTTFSLLLLNFGLNGFTEAVIQRETLDHGLASNLFWVNASACLCLTIAFAAAGPLLSWLYHEPRLTVVTQAIALTILFTGLSVIHIALLRRAMRFAAVSINDIGAQVSSVAVSVLLAYRGWGYWALVAGTVTAPLMSAVGAWWQCRWIPGLPRRGRGTRAMVRFAMNIYGYFTVNYFSRNLDNLLVGWFFGPQALGFYKKAFDLAIFPIVQASGPLNSVAVPTLSRLTGDPEKYCRYILRSLSILAFTGMGAGACLTLVGRDVIRIVLGPKWEEAGRIFMFFGPGIGAMFIYRISGWLHLSMGTANRFFRWALIEMAALCVLFAIGLPWGPVGIGAAWGVSCWILTIPAILYAPRPPQLRLSAMFAVVWRYAAASAIAGAVSAVIVRWVPWHLAGTGAAAGFVRLTLTSSLFAVLYLLAIAMLYGSWAPLLEVVDLVRDMLPSRVRPKSSALTMSA